MTKIDGPFETSTGEWRTAFENLDAKRDALQAQLDIRHIEEALKRTDADIRKGDGYVPLASVENPADVAELERKLEQLRQDRRQLEVQARDMAQAEMMEKLYKAAQHRKLVGPPKLTIAHREWERSRDFVARAITNGDAPFYAENEIGFHRWLIEQVAVGNVLVADPEPDLGTITLAEEPPAEPEPADDSVKHQCPLAAMGTYFDPSASPDKPSEQSGIIISYTCGGQSVIPLKLAHAITSDRSTCPGCGAIACVVMSIYR